MKREQETLFPQHKKLNDFMVETTGETGIPEPHWTIRIYSLQHTRSIFAFSGCGSRDARLCFAIKGSFYTSVFISLLIT